MLLDRLGITVPESVAYGSSFDLPAFLLVAVLAGELLMPWLVRALASGFAPGSEFLIECDMVIAAKSASFIEAFCKLGLIPDTGGTYFLPRVVGMAKACEMIFTGQIIDAAEALRLGIVSAVHAPEDLMPASHALAAKIAGKK